MICPACSGTGVLSFILPRTTCTVCRGRGNLPDTRLEICPPCTGTGRSSIKLGALCETCDGWGRLPNEPSGEAEKEASLKQNIRDLHPAIYEKCKDLFLNRAFAEAAEKGFKVVRDRLRELTTYETGSEAFGKGKLHVKGAAAPNVDEDFNEGVKFLTMAVDRFRNEKSHTSDGKIDDPVRAYEYLTLSSLAMNLLDGAEVRQ